MNVIAEIKTRLGRYPMARFVETATSIKVLPQDGTGFPVTMYTTTAGYTVEFYGWHEEFTSPEEALRCFAFGLSEACRMRVVYRGAMPTKWIVEARRDGAWVADSETGLIFVPFWLPRRIVYLQNRLIPAT
jgi:hypothetical protein